MHRPYSFFFQGDVPPILATERDRSLPGRVYFLGFLCPHGVRSHPTSPQPEEKTQVRHQLSYQENAPQRRSRLVRRYRSVSQSFLDKVFKLIMTFRHS